MKKNILALAVASAIVAPVAMADEGKKGPQVYGKFNIAVEMPTDQGQQVNHRASRFGVKGSEDLGDGVKAIYKAEGEIDDAGNFGFGRDTWFGFEAGFGQVRLGRHDTPLKINQVKDQFNDSYYGDNRRFNGQIGANKRSGEVRDNDAVMYMSPDFGGIKLMAGLYSQNAATAEDSALTNTTSLALVYGSNKKGVYAAVSMNALDSNSGDGTETRVAVQYAEGALIAGVQYDMASFEKTDTTNINGSTISANVGYKMGNLMPKVKFASIAYDTATNDETSTSMGVGVDYKLAKSATLYAEYVTLDDKNTAAGGDTLSVVSVGASYKF
jgi:predicted porin